MLPETLQGNIKLEFLQTHCSNSEIHTESTHAEHNCPTGIPEVVTLYSVVGGEINTDCNPPQHTSGDIKSILTMKKISKKR